MILLAPAGRALEPTDTPGKAEQTAPVTAASGADSPQPLSADELRELSERDEEPGPDVQGGALSNLHLTYAVIALATAVIVLLATR